MLNCFKSSATDDVVVEADYDVVPVPLLHQIPLAIDIMLTIGLVVRGQLDTEKLRVALEDLAKLGEWRKIGSRIRSVKTKDRFVMHIPKSFSPTCPAFQWSEQDQRTQTAAAAGVSPNRSASDTVTFHPPLSNVVHLYRPPQFAQVFSDVLKSSDPVRRNESILSVSVVTFADATLLSITLPHLFTDAVGIQNVFAAWASMTAGRPQDVPPVVGFSDDILAEIDGEYDPQLKPEDRARATPTLKYVMRLLPSIMEMVLGKQETRVIFLPDRVLERLKGEANTESSELKASSEVTQGDVVSAILMKAYLLHSRGDSTPFSMGYAANARGRVPPLESSTASAGYLGFSVLQCYTAPTTVQTVQTSSVPQLARYHRTSVSLLQDPTEAHAIVGEVRRANGRKQMTSVPGRSAFATNWCARKPLPATALDFSGALVEDSSDAKEKSSSTPGRVSFVGGYAAPIGTPRLSWAIVLGRDGPAVAEAERGIWVETAFTKKQWPAVEAYLHSL